MNEGDFVAVLKGTADLLQQNSTNPVCPECQGPTEPNHIYCGKCGRRLRFACPRCQAECRLSQGYCPSCGFQLTAKAVSASEARAALEEQAKRQSAMRRSEEQRRPAKDIMNPFTEVVKLREQRCLKLRARHCDSGELRFLKRSLGTENKELLENEATVLSTVSHPHLVRMYEAHRHADQLVLELEHVKAQRLRFPLAIERLCRIMHQVAQALEALHQHGFVHGDIKPPNILLRDGPKTDSDEAVVCDLEFAQKPGPNQFKAITPLFSAPEQIVGDYLDFRADVYSFGIVLYLWFIYDRLPAIVDAESATYQAMGRILKSAPRVLGTPLHDATLFDDASTLMVPSLSSKRQESRLNYPVSEEEVLGAKYHFGAELERITHINRRLDVTEDILKLVSDATEVNAARRPANGSALVKRMEQLLKKLDGPCQTRVERSVHSVSSSTAVPPGQGGSSQDSADSVNASEPGEGTFAQQAELRMRLGQVKNSWVPPLARHSTKQEVPGEAQMRTVIVSLSKGELMRVRSAETNRAKILLLNEYEALEAVHHENVVSLRWATRHDRQLFVATSWREVNSLDSVPYPIPWLLTRIAEALRGVSAIHRAGLVHGDLKPATLLMGDTWTLVSDLKFAAPPGKREKRLFTPKFAAPEQVLGEHVGPAADIYALGMTLYTMFIRARFPMILRGAEGATVPVATSEMMSHDDDSSDMPILDSETTMMTWEAPERRQPSRKTAPNASSSQGPDFLLGVKVRFHRRLTHVLDAAQHAGMVGEILHLVRTATQLKPDDRFRSCEEFESAIQRLLTEAPSQPADRTSARE